MTRVKICGLTTAEQAAAAAAAGADFIGLVFVEGSRRHVSVHEARSIIAGLPVSASAVPSIAAAPSRGRPPARWFDSSAAYLDERLQRRRPLVVGVFADMSATMINAIAERVGLDLVQLSGHEPWEEALAIRRPVIKAIRVAAQATPAAVLEQIEVGTASLCLLDTEHENALGGTGRRFDWRVAATVAGELPLVLAGGLTPENVREAVASVQPWGVDVSSGVETQGIKDPEKIGTFVRAAKTGGETEVR